MSTLHPEKIEALIIRCIDYRFVTQSNKFKENLGLTNNYDLIAYPGASKNIHQLFDAIEVSNRLHKPKKILIMNHEDCGAFPPNATKETHVQSLEKAEKLLNVEFPGIPVELYYSKFNGVERIK